MTHLAPPRVQRRRSDEWADIFARHMADRGRHLLDEDAAKLRALFLEAMRAARAAAARESAR